MIGEGVPVGWVESTLGEVRLDRTRSIDPRKLPDKIFELYSVPGFQELRPDIVAGSAIGSSKRTVEENTVLVCKINPRINRIWIVGNHSEHLKIASTEWLGFSELENLYSKFLCYYLRQEAFRNYLAVNASGVGGSLMRIKASTFEDYPIPLPPLSEQHRIVAEIDKQFTRLDASVASLKRAQGNLKRYRSSVLKAACEGRLVPAEAELAQAEGRDYEPAGQLLECILAERRGHWSARRKRRGKYKEPVPPETAGLPELPAGWVWCNLGQMAVVGTGSTPLKSKRQFYEGGSVPWTTSGALNCPEIRKSNNFVTEQAVRECNLALYAAGTLLVAMYGEGKTRGKCSELLIKSTINQAIAALSMRGSATNCRQYSKIFLVSNYEETRRRSAGGVQPNLNLGLVRQIIVSLPPLAEQCRIVAEVERRLSVIQQAEAAVEAGLTRADRLRQSILKQAFSGKLVPQDPNDEPAALLLERIRAERASAEVAARAQRKTRRRRSRPKPAGQLSLSEETP